MSLALFASYIDQVGRIQGGFEDTEVVQPSTFGVLKEDGHEVTC